jgi:hypothetical protein
VTEKWSRRDSNLEQVIPRNKHWRTCSSPMRRQVVSQIIATPAWIAADIHEKPLHIASDESSSEQSRGWRAAAPDDLATGLPG